MYKISTIFLILIFVISCVSTTYTPPGQKKAAFNPKMDTDCVYDSTIATGYNSSFACATDNGVVYIKHTVLSKYKLNKSQLDARAQKFCELSDRNAEYAGKANIALMSKLDWHGEEYLCK